MSDPIVGIDLGTSNTVVAYADATGSAQVLADGSGIKIHPSVVSFHPNGGVVVGAPAKQRKVIDPKNTIFSVKRLIGRSFKSKEVQTAKSRMPYQIKEGANQLPIIVTRGGEFAVPEISAIVLDHAKNIASQSLGTDVTRAVVTVPASFNDAQRSATATAGSIANMTVVRVLNEPTAAALAYGNMRDLRETIAVYDFGGGTFDITVLKLADQVYEVLGTAGDSFLGGDDLDERLVDRMVEKFLAENRVDLRTNEVSMMRLRAVAEQTKIELSRRSRAVVRVDEIAYGPRGKPLDLQIEIRREEFVSQVADIIDKTFPVCEEALKLAGLTIDHIDDVILVGGTTKIPYVRDQVTKFFAKAPRTDINPEDAVAVGAGLQATALERILNRTPGRPGVTEAEPADDTGTFQPDDSATFGGDGEGNETIQVERDELPVAPGTFELDLGEETIERAPPRAPPPRAPTGGDRRASRGEHHDRFETRTPPPAPAAPPGQPVIGRLTKPVEPRSKTSIGMPIVQAPGATPPPTPGKGSTAPRLTAQRPPAMPAASPQAKTMMLDTGGVPDAPLKHGQISTVIVDPSAGDDDDIGFPNLTTEKGFLDLDDGMPPSSTAKGMAPAKEPSPASTAKGFTPPAAPQARTQMMQAPTPPPPRPQPSAPPPRPAPPNARTQMLQPAPSSDFELDLGPASTPTQIAPAPAAPPLFSTSAAPTMIADRPSAPQPSPMQPAAMFAGAPKPSPVVLDVTPRGLGIATVAGFCEELIRRNSRLPMEMRKSFVTSRDYQESVRIIVVQGESRRMDANVVIAELKLENLPARPRGETSIEVTFQLDASGILHVHARDAQTGKATKASLNILGSVPQEDVAASRERLQALRR